MISAGESTRPRDGHKRTMPPYTRRMARTFPTHRDDISMRLALNIADPETLARMAMVCRGWRAAAMHAPGYRVRLLRRDAQPGHTLAPWQGHTAHTGYVYALAELPGGMVASGSQDETVALWHVETGQRVRTLTGHTSSVNALVSLPGGLLASCSYDCTVWIWKAQTGQLLRTLEGHTHFVNALLVLPGNQLASCSSDKTVRVWNAETGAQLRTLEGHTSAVMSLAVLPAGLIASGSMECWDETVRDKNGTVRIWKVETGELVRTMPDQHSWVAALVSLSGGLLAVGCGETNDVHLWNVETGQLVRTLVGHKSNVNTLLVLPGDILASGSNDGTVRLWEPETGRCVRTLDDGVGQVRSLTSLAGGLLAAGKEYGTVAIWRVAAAT